jgi:hypothetical protein
MDRKEICEYLVQNEVPGELMAYADHGELGCAAVASNGMKFVFSAEKLAETEEKLKPKPKPVTKRKTTRKKRTTSK